jgi:hypothetical protein
MQDEHMPSFFYTVLEVKGTKKEERKTGNAFQAFI